MTEQLWKQAELELAKHGDEYFDNEFVPFPTVDAAVEAITETAYGYCTAWIGEAFCEEIARRLLADVERRNKEFAESYEVEATK